jgi:hypothetical protein
MQKTSTQPDHFSILLNTEIEKERAKGDVLSARFLRLAKLLALHVEYKKTPHDGWKATLLAGRLRIPAPTWAIDLLEKAERDAIKRIDDKGGKIDISIALGFKGQGKGESKNAPVQRGLQDEHHELLCWSVRMLVAFGIPLKSACEMVARKLKQTPDWNETAYPLRAPNPESLQRRYHKWEKRRGEEVLSIYDKGFASVPREIQEQLLVKFRS